MRPTRIQSQVARGFLLSLLLLLLVPLFSLAQKNKIQRLGNLEFVGAAKHAGVNLPGVVVTVLAATGDSTVYTTQGTGNFLLYLDLNKSYDIYFRKEGYITRYVRVNAAVPEEEKYTDFSFKFNMELYTAADKMSPSIFTKPAARIFYDNNFADFDFDGMYNKRMQEEVKRSKDSLIAIKNDSIYKVKLKTDSLANAQLEKEKQARELKAKAMADSLAKADADAKAKKAAEALKLEIEKQARAKADSIARAQAAADAKAKAEAERLKALEAAKLKAREDSIAKAKIESDRLKALAEQREKARQDSIARDNEAKAKAEAERLKALEAAKLKAREDSIAKAKIESDRLKALAEQREKARQDSIARDNQAKAKAEAERLKAMEAAKLKAREDSIAKAKLLKDKLAEEKRLADIAAQKKVTPEPEKKKNTQELPKVDREYPEGATQETIKEARRVILRTVVNREGTQYVLYRVEYDWGGIFFFKNDASISEAKYNQEVQLIKALLKK